MVAFLSDAPPEQQTEYETFWNECVTINEKEISDSTPEQGTPAPQESAEDTRIAARYPLLGRKLRVPEAARLVGIGQTEFRKMVRAGRIPVIRFGQTMQFHAADLERFVEQNRITMTGRRPPALRRSLPDRVVRSPYLQLERFG
jgi:excisionase family DNA binding protein